MTQPSLGLDEKTMEHFRWCSTIYLRTDTVAPTAPQLKPGKENFEPH
jgi:hypothetical protein